MSNPKECHKYNTCSASICPLDDNWRKREHLKGERVCVFLTEAIKNPLTPESENASKTNFKGVIEGGIGVRVYDTLAEILKPHSTPSKNKGNKHGTLKRQLERSAKLAQAKVKREAA